MDVPPAPPDPVDDPPPRPVDDAPAPSAEEAAPPPPSPDDDSPLIPSPASWPLDATYTSWKPPDRVAREPRVRKTRPLSRATVVLTSLTVIAVVGLLAVTLLTKPPDGADVRSMSPGQCYVESDSVQESGRRIPFGRRVPCVMGAPRVVAVLAMPEGRYPGPDFIADTADEICRDTQDWVIAPTTETWLEGDRTLVCIDLP